MTGVNPGRKGCMKHDLESLPSLKQALRREYPKDILGMLTPVWNAVVNMG